MNGVVPVPGVWDAPCVDERVLDRSKGVIDGGAGNTPQSLRMKLATTSRTSPGLIAGRSRMAGEYPLAVISTCSLLKDGT
jgi:hypothetical protein